MGRPRWAPWARPGRPELGAQCDRLGVAVRVVVVAAGSGGTLAGLVAGQVGFGLPWRTVGASVSRPAADLAADVLALARGCADLLGLRAADPCHVDVRDLPGPGFGVPAGEDRVSADLALRREGLLLDHYYGAKAMTLLRSLLAGGSSDADRLLAHRRRRGRPGRTDDGGRP